MTAKIAWILCSVNVASTQRFYSNRVKQQTNFHILLFSRLSSFYGKDTISFVCLPVKVWSTLDLKSSMNVNSRQRAEYHPCSTWLLKPFAVGRPHFTFLNLVVIGVPADSQAHQPKPCAVGFSWGAPQHPILSPRLPPCLHCHHPSNCAGSHSGREMCKA